MEDSRHAVGLKLKNGLELILHIGLDTVNMKGDGFTYLVKEGQQVKAGDGLIQFDREKIRKAGYRDVTICVITNYTGEKPLVFLEGRQVTAGKTDLLPEALETGKGE